WSRAYGRALSGDVTGAAADAEILQKLAPAMPYTSQITSLVHAMSGRADAARAALGEASGLDAHHKFHLAEAYAMAGDHDRALDLLGEAVHGGFHPGEFISTHCPFFVSLRGSPRFEALAADAVRLTAEFGAAAGRPRAPAAGT
ncbi:MAG: hypothetical protein H0U85_02210, partial [Gemmatimonadales bacterium]|nr:hypothetical protein [Gemmatimonadales bacterium]